MRGLASRLNRFVRVERPVPDTSFDGAGSGEWELLAEVWAEIVDMLPSRGERLADGINVATRPARVRIRHRTDVTNAMRIVAGAHVVNGAVDYSGARIMQITTLPAELGRREGLEFMVEDSTPKARGA